MLANCIPDWCPDLVIALVVAVLGAAGFLLFIYFMFFYGEEDDP